MKIRGRGSSENTSDNTDLSLLSSTPAPPDKLQITARSEITISGAARDFIRASLSGASRRAYKGDLAHFRAWGGSIPSTPSQIAQYLADHAGKLAVATLRRRLVGIAKAHIVNGYPDPVDSEAVRMTLRGIRRTKGKPQTRARPISCADLLRMVGNPSGVQDARDHALLLVGFAGAFRRSELVALDVEDLEFVDEGLIVTLRRSKTDQEGVGRRVAVPLARGNTCPVRAVRQWLESAGICSGPVFRSVTRSGRILPDRLSSQSVALIVKRHSKRIGLDPDEYAGHSLRAGFATGAAKAGAPLHKIAAQTGHRSHAMLMRYVRDADLFTEHPLREML